MGDYRLGIDIGTNSIGWCAVTLDESDQPCGILDAGVRILTPSDEAGRDPKSKQSLAANRRAARSMRRRRDRFLRRRARLQEVLVEAGLLPAERSERKKLEALDPYWLRAKALDQRLEPREIGRALLHLNKQRGFKSNRLADATDKDRGAVRTGAEALERRLRAEGVRTLGELLARWHDRDKWGNRPKGPEPREAEAGSVSSTPVATAAHPVRFRPTAKGARNLYDFYPTREMIQEEIERVWEAQGRWYPDLLTPRLLDRMKRIIIEQRPLKKPLVGRCTLKPDVNVVGRYGLEIDLGERTPKAHPLFQRYRVLQDVCQLRVRPLGLPERHLSMRERDAIADVLGARSSIVPFEKLRAVANLPDDARFNYEGWGGRKGLPPDETAAKLSGRKAFGRDWRRLSQEAQIEVVERLLAVEDEHDLRNWLQKRFDLSNTAARAVVDLRLPQGHCQFGRAMLEKLVAVMEKESREEVDKGTGEILRRPVTYDEAVRSLDLHHSDRRPEERKRRLPYYGDVMARHVISWPHAKPGSQEHRGRVSNPTVHIGLNQVRRVVNALIGAHGPPAEIVVELARDLKLNAKRKKELLRRQREDKARNDTIRSELADLGYAETHDKRMLLRLYYELPADERVCAYSGVPISKQMLFSGEVEIDHILPHSRTLDDGFMNKVLCTRPANRVKNNRTPAEAWTGDELREIMERAQRVVPRKAWRFAPDAIERLCGDDAVPGARHLVDTQYMSRIAKEYLEFVCPRVRASPGRLTAMLRAKWGLNGLLDHDAVPDAAGRAKKAKNRLDHRHHAVDAFVVACTDQGLLSRVAKASGRAEELNLDRLYPKSSFPVPFNGYREALASRLDLERFVVSHKTDHGVSPGARRSPRATSGRLLEDTAYGLVDEVIDGKSYNLVFRKPVDKLSSKEVQCVRDPLLRAELQEATKGRTGKKLTEALMEFGKSRGIRRVRVLKTEQSVRVVRHGDGFEKAYVPGANHRIEIFELPNGKWQGEGVTVFDANRPGFEPAWRTKHPDAKLVLVVHKGDSIEADFGKGRTVYRVVSLEPSADRLRLAPHHAAVADPPYRKLKSYGRLKAAAARVVRVDPIGRVYPAVPP